MAGKYFIMRQDDVLDGNINTLEEAEKKVNAYLPDSWDGETLRPSQRISICKEIVEYGTRWHD